MTNYIPKTLADYITSLSMEHRMPKTEVLKNVTTEPICAVNSSPILFPVYKTIRAFAELSKDYDLVVDVESQYSHKNFGINKIYRILGTGVKFDANKSEKGERRQ